MARIFRPHRHHGGCMIVDRTEAFDPSKLHLEEVQGFSHYFIKNDADDANMMKNCPICTFKTTGFQQTANAMNYITNCCGYDFQDAVNWIINNTWHANSFINSQEYGCINWGYQIYLYEYGTTAPTKVVIGNGYYPVNNNQLLCCPAFRGPYTNDNYENAIITIYGTDSRYNDIAIWEKRTNLIAYSYDGGDQTITNLSDVKLFSYSTDRYSQSEAYFCTNNIYSWTLKSSKTPNATLEPSNFNIITSISTPGFLPTPKVYYVNPDLTNYAYSTIYTDMSDFLVEAQNENYLDYFINPN